VGDLVQEQGMRAKEENSSTMRLRSPTCRTMVPVSRSKVEGSDLISPE
jgi:hypothetical protein